MLYEGCQNDMINGDVKKYGCYFLSIARLVELQEGADFSAKDITVYWNAARLKGVVDDNLDITDASKAYNLLAEKNVCAKVLKTATKPENKAHFIRLGKPGYTHYVLSFDGDVWDSLPPDRPAAKEYKPVGYRVLA
jgi:hypothetical protein